jgi:SAM-dependent methyltransferase
VLHIAPGNPAATILGDLTQADHIPDNTFDCFILTQTLHLLFDVKSAVETVRRILKPGGVVLATVPGLSQPSADQWSANWYWSLSAAIMQPIFSELFGPDSVTVKTYGNKQAATAFMYGLARHELTAGQLDVHDPTCELLIAVRAVKQEAC